MEDIRGPRLILIKMGHKSACFALFFVVFYSSLYKRVWLYGWHKLISGYLSLFRNIQCHFSSFRLISDSLSSFWLIPAYLGPFRFMKAHLTWFKLTFRQLSLYRILWALLGWFWFFWFYLDSYHSGSLELI